MAESGMAEGLTRLEVPAAGVGAYPVVVGEGLLERLGGLLRRHAPAARYALVSDSTVESLHGRRVLAALRDDGLDVFPLTFPAGEASKSRAVWAHLTDAMLEAGLGRDAVVVALGGGVTGDLAGFVAATFMRGVPVVQLPTSVVAMVDASVGGKTGVDVPAGKNLVGAFHPPALVAVDPAVIRTLPREERSRGMAEAVKHGAILDEAYFDAIARDADRILAGEPAALHAVVLRSIRLKAEVVGRDEREGGVRRILNFGHTVGHALEASSDYAVPHGEAVALGMILECRLGERLGTTAKGTAERLRGLLARLELPVEPARPVDVEAVLAFTRSDKKSVAGEPRYVLLSRIGAVDPGSGWVRSVPADLVRDLLREGW